MARTNDYTPVSEDGGKNWIVRSKSTGNKIYRNNQGDLFPTKREAQLEADYQNKSTAGKAWALLRRDPCAVGE